MAIGARRERWAGIRGILAVALLLALPSPGHGPARGAVAEAGERATPRVAATIFPLYDIARQVAVDVAPVTLLLPPGASPHTFEPTPGVVRALAGARAIFAIGHGLDDWAVRAAAAAGVERIVRVDQELPIRIPAGAGDARGSLDPHYWLAVPNAKAIARTVAAELARAVPGRRGEVERNLGAYLERLDAADADARRRLAGLPTREIATFHDAFRYFARAYGLEVAAVFEPFPGREPGPLDVREFQRRVREAGVRVLFYEPQIPVETLRPVARDLGLTLAVLDPLGGVAGRDRYIDLVRFDVSQVVRALGAQAG